MRVLVLSIPAGVFLIACATAEREHGEKSAAALSFAEGDNDGYTGTTLGDKQLALTFDDGPGSRTLELSAWLRDQGIRATFFVNGMHYGADPGAMITQVVADGHLVGNHTQDHLDLTSLSDRDIVSELEETDAIIAPYVPQDRFLFRAPYGNWNSHDYDVLEATPMKKYVGPVKWSIGGEMTSSYGADWDCWQNTDGYGVMTTKACGDRYLAEIRDRGHGIILCHDQDYGDSSNHALEQGKGNTVDMIEYIVPILKSEGYTFVRVDEVPDVAKAFGSADAGTTDSGGGGACSFDPSWAQTEYANDWWIEYKISGDITAASLEVIGGATTTLSQSYGKWVGGPPAEISEGMQVRLHATNSAGQTAMTTAFPYMTDTTPPTDCGGSDAGGGTQAPACFTTTWSEGDGANTWWVEYNIGGPITSAYLEVPGKVNVTLAKDQWGKWAGSPDVEIPEGWAVIVHATNAAGEATQTKPFAYLDVTKPSPKACP